MADKTPLKANLTSGAATSLGEFATGDTVPITHGGTGATTAAAALTALGGLAIGPAFKANKTSALQNIATNTPTKLDFNNELYDSAGNFASARFTPQVAGWYLIRIRKYIIPGASPGATSLDIFKNGTREIRVFYGIQTVASIEGSSLVQFNGTTDYVEAFASNTSTTLVADADTTIDEFSGHFVHP